MDWPQDRSCPHSWIWTICFVFILQKRTKNYLPEPPTPLDCEGLVVGGAPGPGLVLRLLIAVVPVLQPEGPDGQSDPHEDDDEDAADVVDGDAAPVLRILLALLHRTVSVVSEFYVPGSMPTNE